MNLEIEKFPQTTLHALFEDNAKKSPEKSAIIFQDTNFTYKELNERSNLISNSLYNDPNFKKQGTLIALLMDTSDLLIATILGIWKSRAAFIPLNPKDPDLRLKFILEDSNPDIIITNKNYIEKINAISDQYPKLIAESLLQSSSDENRIFKKNLPAETNDLVYITYTSGTTGKPKGVFKEHKGLINSLLDLSEKYSINPDYDVVCLFSTYTFEPFYRQILMALLNSCTVAIPKDEEKLDPKKFLAFLNRHKITYLNGTATVLINYILNHCNSLNKLMLVGEEMTKTLYENVRNVYKKDIFIEYGFTESAFVTTVKKLAALDERNNRSIGKPLKNVICYVLNDKLEIIKQGEEGELYVGGLGVSRGYMNRPTLTKERFLLNPFQTQIEKNLSINNFIYKTGDLARELPNGEIEFLGRNDFQIKINGIRIEPGEIEVAICEYPKITECRVVAKRLKPENDFYSYLYGYYVSNNTISEKELVDFLKSILPQHMIPARLIQIDEIPTTPNGKVDLRALPNDSFESRKIIFRDEIDKDLAVILAELLNIKLIELGNNSDFFKLGGNSITCIQLISKIKNKFDCELSISEIFNARDIEKIADIIKLKLKNCLRSVSCDIKDYFHNPDLYENQKEKESIKISSNNLQKGFIYNYLKRHKYDDSYVIQYLYSYNSRIDVKNYIKSWELAKNIFPSLRLKFSVEKEHFYQIIDNNMDLDWKFIDLNNDQNIVLFDDELERILNHDRRKDYNLESGNLIRIYLVKKNDENFYLIFSAHHIIIDGWSINILLDFVHNSYSKITDNSYNNCFDFSTDDILFSYIESQLLLQKYVNENDAYWLGKLSGINDKCNLNSILKEKYAFKFSFQEYDFVKDQGEKTLILTYSEELNNFTSSLGITLHSLLQFVWHKVLNVYENVDQTVTGTIVSGRNINCKNIEKSVGLYINTLPLIIDHEKIKELTCSEALCDLQMEVNEMITRSNVSFFNLEVGIKKKELFHSLFVLENYPNLGENSKIIQNQLNFKLLKNIEKFDFPLVIIAREIANKQVTFSIFYDKELFDEENIEDILTLVDNLIRQIIENPNKKISDLDVIIEKHFKLIQKWNQTDQDFPRDKTLIDIFEEQVFCNKDKIALVFENKKITYKELDSEANQLANYLANIKNFNKEDKIALFLDKSEYIIISIIAVWKISCAYVPIDNSYPDERIEYILKDIETQMIITNEKFSKRLDIIREKIEREENNNKKIEIYSVESSSHLNYTNFKYIEKQKISSTDLAYIIYTSGTTGNPKGVMIEHKGVVNLQTSLSKLFSLQQNKNEVICSFSNYVFDHFVEVYTDALLNGLTLVILNDSIRANKKLLYKYLNDNKVTYLSGTPSVLSLYEFDSLPFLKRIDAIGEDFTEITFEKIRSTFDGVIIDGYGPTEISITSHKRIYELGEKRHNKTIGFQIANTKSYVVDKKLKLVPIGVIGELLIGGEGVSRGYLNQKELTDEKFIENIFTSREEKSDDNRLYKTGDLVRFLKNGEVEFFGRNDFQVKVNGRRIEIAEIESYLSSYQNITSALILFERIDTDSSEKALVGYYVSPELITEKSVINYLNEKLPQYMIPKRLIQIDKIPLNVNGKIDTKKLPKLSREKVKNHTPASNEIEIKILRLWSEVLKIPSHNICINDDFFSLGGDSKRITILYFKISETFEIEFNLENLYKNRSIKKQANFITSNNHNFKSLQTICLNNENLNQNHQISFNQESLIFINSFEKGNEAYNIKLTYEIENHIESEILKQSFIEIIMRHEILRTVYYQNENNLYLQKIILEDEAKNSFIFEVHEEEEKNFQENINSFSKNIFDLKKDLPIKVMILNDRKNSISVLIVLVHHISFDEWSEGILVKELKYYYEQLVNLKSSKAINLPKLDIQYKDYSNFQRKNFNNQKTNISEFCKKFLDNYEPIDLPLDYRRPVFFDYSGKEIEFRLGEERTKKLKLLSKKFEVSLYSVFVGAFCLVLSFYSNQNNINIGLPISERNRSELENLIGYFVNMGLLQIKINPNLDLKDYLQYVMDQIIQSQINKNLPFRKIVSELNIDHDASKHPIIQVIVNFEALNYENIKYKEVLNLKNYTKMNNLSTIAKFDLSLNLKELENDIIGHLNYADKLFKKSSIESYIKTLKLIIDQFLESDSEKNLYIKEIRAISREEFTEKTKIFGIESFTDENKSLKEIFEEIVEKFSDNIAIVYKEIKYSFKNLLEKVNQFSYYLIKNFGLRNSDKIALVLDKNEFMIISILSAFITGNAYVPIDPSFPQDRIDYILKDTGAKIILTNKSHSRKFVNKENKGFLIEVDDDEVIANVNQQSSKNLPNTNNRDSIAYVIYTSGTTGRPKGVVIKEIGVVNLRNNLISKYFNSKLGEESILFLANYTFDSSIEQLVLSLFGGNKLIVIDNNFSINDDFYKYVNNERLTFISGTPSFIKQFDFSKFFYLQYVLVAGEAFQKNHFEKIRETYKGLLINAYGVTEGTVCSHYYIYSNEKQPYVNSLGNTLSNIKTYVLNKNMQIVPEGAFGELYITGVCLSVGYLNIEDLNKQSFINNKFPANENKNSNYFKKIYKTGDVVRFLVNGDLEYMGRKDDQIKLRGFRINLKEIENIILSYQYAKECAVIPVYDKINKNEIRSLKAFYVSSSLNDEVEIKIFLEVKVPKYMIPSKIIKINGNLPTNINGKIDLKYLSSLNENENKMGVSPRNQVEVVLSDIWKSILQLEEIFIDDDFFNIGGDSILLLKSEALIRRSLGLEISIRDLYVHNTIRKIYDNLYQNKAIKIIIPENIVYGQEFKLLPIQEWFFGKKIKNKNKWNQTFSIEIPKLDVQKLKTSVDTFVNFHETFKLRFKKTISNNYVQYYSKTQDNYIFKEFDLDKLFENEIEIELEKIGSSFDIEKGPLLGIAYIYQSERKDSILWFTVHHLICDFVCWSIIIRDLKAIYENESLSWKTNSLLTWSKNLDNLPINDEEEIYWEKIHNMSSEYNCRLEGSNSVLLFDQFDIPLNKNYHIDLNIKVLTAVGYALKAITGEVKNFITFESHGREEILSNINVSNTIGWFTTLIPFMLETNDNLSESEILIKEEYARIPKKGIGYGKLYGYLNIPLITFNNLGKKDRKKGNNNMWNISYEELYTPIRSEYLDIKENSIIDITCINDEDKINLNISSRLLEEKHLKFQNSFKKTLNEILNMDKRNNTLMECREESQIKKLNEDYCDEPFIDYNPDKDNVIFFFPPGEGGGESYLNNLAKYLKNYRLILFDNFYLKESKSFFFEELAAIYIENLKKIKPKGPYNLLGWSFGGVLGFEIAYQLIKMGEKINNLVIIDSYFDLKTACGNDNTHFSLEKIDKIYANYEPFKEETQNLFSDCLKVILFKAREISHNRKGDEHTFQIEKYYCQKTIYNHLDNYLNPEKISLYNLEHDDHYSWATNEKTVLYVCNILNEAIL